MTVNERRIARSVGIVMAGFVASKALGFVREVVIAYAFGTSAELDAYYAAFNLPDLLYALIPGGALASVFIPVLAGYLTKEDQAGAWELASAVVNAVFLVVALLGLAIALAAPILVPRVLAPGFSPAQQALTVDLIRLVLLSTLIFGMSGVATGVLHAHQHFLLPAIAPVLYNLGIIGGALFLAPDMGVYGLAAGVATGAAMHLAIQMPALIRHGVRWMPTLGFSSAGFREVVRLIGPRILTIGVVRLNYLVMTNLASRLGEGSVSALNYGWLVMQLPESIIGTAIGIAVFPTLSELAAKGQREALRSTLSGALRAVFALTIPAAVGLVVLGRPLIQLLFQRGAFGVESTEAVRWALQFYALGLIGHSALEVVARIFYAQHDTRTPLAVAATATLAHLALSLWWMNVWGHGGLALANSVAVTLEVLGLLWIAQRRLAVVEGTRMLIAVLRSGFAAAVMGIILFVFTAWGQNAGTTALGLGGTVLGALVYLAVMLALGSEEIRALPRMVLEKQPLDGTASEKA
ncbi:MAG: murein biosynthesis integral membrane protein MurJ [Chloroflexi bacterium]|nr:murein biosynthesis integral membrane protein MurJ [Chloroflexota bacterium]